MSFHELASAWWSWIAPLSLQAAALALGLAVFDLVARRRIWPSVRAALWWVVVLRLVLPPGVCSPWSVVPSFTSARVLAPVAAPGATSTSWPWAVVLAALWLSGVSAGTWREWRRERALRRELARMHDAPAHVVRVLERLSRHLGLRRAPRLRISARFASPLLIGWWRPIVVLPAAMVGDEDDALDVRVARRDLSLALVHELTHVRRNHALQSALLRALHVVFWFHPAAWIATRRLAELRELVCDAAVIRGRAHLAAHYRDALLRVAGRVRDVPQPAQAFFAGSSLLLRLDWLDRRATRLRALHAPLAAAVFVSACACLLPGAPAAKALAGLSPEVAQALERLRRAIDADERQNCLEVQAAARVLFAHREITGEDLLATLASPPRRGAAVELTSLSGRSRVFVHPVPPGRRSSISMKFSRILALSAVAASAAVLTSLGLAQGAGDSAGSKPKQLSPQFDAAGMQRYMEVCKPDFHHEKLADWIGKWDTEIRIGPPGAQSVSKGTAEFSWLFEKRWLQQRTDGELALGPQKYKLQGLGLLGYDRFKEKYVGASCDTMTTNMLHFEGNFDRTDTALILFGPMDEPMSGEHDKCVKYIWRLLDKDKLVFEVHDLPIGEEPTKVFEVTYTRHKN